MSHKKAHLLNAFLLLLTGALEVNAYQYFGYGSGPINMDNVNCNGSETTLFDCQYLTIHNCYHFEDVGLVCLESCSPDGIVRLSGGKNSNEGRVEICKNQKWTTICDDGWDNSDAAVACKSVGLSGEGTNASYKHACDQNRRHSSHVHMKTYLYVFFNICNNVCVTVVTDNITYTHTTFFSFESFLNIYTHILCFKAWY